jgi:hypothetical protein
MKKQIMSKRGRRFDEGGEVQNMPRARTAAEDREAEDKAAGLEASNKEKSTGFFERLRMGNIDDPNSEAYKRFGAGRGRADRAPVIGKPLTTAEAPAKPSAITSRSEGMGSANAAIQARKNAETAGQPSGDASVAEAMASMPDRARQKIAARPMVKPAKKEVDPTAGEARDKAAQAAADEQGDRPLPFINKPEKEDKPKKEVYRNFSGKMVEKTPDIANPMAGLGSLIGRGAKAMGEAYDKYEFMTPAKRIAKENKEKREARGYKSGGSVASSRADGIAQRGKTRGKMC